MLVLAWHQKKFRPPLFVNITLLAGKLKSIFYFEYRFPRIFWYGNGNWKVEVRGFESRSKPNFMGLQR